MEVNFSYKQEDFSYNLQNNDFRTIFKYSKEHGEFSLNFTFYNFGKNVLISSC